MSQSINNYSINQLVKLVNEIKSMKWNRWNSLNDLFELGGGDDIDTDNNERKKNDAAVKRNWWLELSKKVSNIFSKVLLHPWNIRYLVSTSYLFFHLSIYTDRDSMYMYVYM